MDISRTWHMHFDGNKLTPIWRTEHCNVTKECQLHSLNGFKNAENHDLLIEHAKISNLHLDGTIETK